MKIVLNNEEKEILTNILLEELNRIRKYEYLIFTDKETREKYNIERVWGDCTFIDFENGEN